MATRYQERMSGRLDGDFVVFLIGMRVNKLRAVRQWLPIIRAGATMMRRLNADPELGLLGQTSWRSGRTGLMVQYWRSVAHLERFAADPDLPHRAPWLDYYRRLNASGAVGIWHETYQVTAGRYESIYANMPRFGLAAAGEHLPTRQVGQRAAQRRAAAPTTG